MQTQEDWSAVSQEILIKISEQQHNALDNCAAACACTSWRLAVNYSHISSLHLHAHDRSFSQQWQAYLSSKCLVDDLKLTASQACKRHINEASVSWMRSLPTICTSMHVDCCFGSGIGHPSVQAGRLTSLTMQSTPSAHVLAPGLPDLRHMTELTQLQVD